MHRRRFLESTLGGAAAGSLAAAPLTFAAASAVQGEGRRDPFPDYERFDARGLAELVRAGEISALELIEAAAFRLEARNGALNAVVFDWLDRAREMAEQMRPAGPFAGLPFLLKNLGTAMADTPLTMGSRLFAGHRAQADSETVKRFMQAGLVPFGRGNAPEFGISATTEPLFHGPSRNPWDLERTPGGSSGGAAAAVAAGILPMAFASDGGGSARIPASCCGLVSMKPTRGRSPTSLGAALGQELVVARSVRDVAAALDVVSPPAPGAPFAAPPPETPFAAAAGERPERLTIAVSRRSPFGGRPLHPDCIAAVEQAAALCERLGHRVVEAAPDYDFSALAEAMFKGIMATGVAGTVAAREAALGRPAREDELEPYTRAMVEHGRSLTATDYAAALDGIDGFARRFAGFFDAHDVYLTPTLGRPPLPLGELIGSIGDADAYLDILNGFMPFTMQYNAAGLPAMSLPLFWSEAGLPIGVQAGAAYGADARLLRLAAELEEAAPWFDRRPPMADPVR